MLAALNEARIARLLIDASRTSRRRPSIRAQILCSAAGDDDEDAPDLTDLIVALALATDAVVTPLCSGTQQGLASQAMRGNSGTSPLVRLAMELECIPIEKPDDVNLILGQSHFIKTVDDVYEALAGSSPSLRFGLAFCESSGPCLVRRAGNDDELVALAVENALAVGAGHSFVVFLRDGYPVNVLNALKQVPEVCRIYCATANPVEVVVA